MRSRMLAIQQGPDGAIRITGESGYSLQLSRRDVSIQSALEGEWQGVWSEKSLAIACSACDSGVIVRLSTFVRSKGNKTYFGEKKPQSERFVDVVIQVAPAGLIRISVGPEQTCYLPRQWRSFKEAMADRGILVFDNEMLTVLVATCSEGVVLQIALKSESDERTDRRDAA